MGLLIQRLIVAENQDNWECCYSDQGQDNARTYEIGIILGNVSVED